MGQLHGLYTISKNELISKTDKASLHRFKNYYRWLEVQSQQGADWPNDQPTSPQDCA